jgi:Outer membrane lipoprotein carrier protein LolA-like
MSRPAAPTGLGFLLAAGLAGAALAASPAPLSLDQLLRQFAQQPAARARFRETQHLAVLTQPLVSEGTLIYRAPDYLEQRIRSPRAQDMILDHGQLTLQIGRHRRTVALTDVPQLAPLLDCLRATLAGDRGVLEQHFTPRLTGTLASWQLQLVPRSPDMGGMIRRLLLQGDGIRIRSVEILQTNGDEARLMITPLPESAPKAP